RTGERARLRERGTSDQGRVHRARAGSAHSYLAPRLLRGSAAGGLHTSGSRGLLLGLVPGRPVGGERGDAGRLRDLRGPDVLHPPLALLLLLQELALAGDVTAVALGKHVLADRPDGLAGDDPRADGRLDGDLELLARD